MNPQTPKQCLKVQAIGMDGRKSAVFRMAFKMYSKRQFLLLEAGETEPADLAVADLDSPEAAAQLEDFVREHPGVPVLCTSVDPTTAQPWPVLRKPIRMETLFPALEALLTQTQAPKAPPQTDRKSVV